MKTPKGTDLPILNLHGKDYLEVKYRIVWFVEEKPNWSIETEAVAVTDSSAYFKATIKDESGRVRATAHKFENKAGFPDFIEKSETGSIGRALAMIGFGTQFCGDELDEGERIVDSPVAPKKIINHAPKANPQPPADDFPPLPYESFEQEVGSYQFTFGKYNGSKIKDIDVYALDGYLTWLRKSNATFTGRLRQEAPEVIKLIEEFLNTRVPVGAK